MKYFLYLLETEDLNSGRLDSYTSTSSTSVIRLQFLQVTFLVAGSYCIDS